MLQLCMSTESREETTELIVHNPNGRSGRGNQKRDLIQAQDRLHYTSAQGFPTGVK